MVERQAAEVYSDYRIPGLVATEGGSLLRYCECRRTCSDWADIDIQVSRSADGGKSWQRVLRIESGGHTLNNPVMFVDGSRLVLLYCRNYKELWQRVSTDDGKSFSQPRRVDFEHSVDFFYNVVAVGPGHGIVHKGVLLAPVWFAYNRQDEKAHHPSRISTIYSCDGGLSWSVGAPIFPQELVDPSECALAVTAEGEVMISIRHEGDSRHRGLAFSPDGISGWHSLRFEQQLPDPVCMGSMTHRNGLIYHSNCHSLQGRRDLTVKCSRDGFCTYSTLFTTPWGGYSDVAVMGDKLYIYYEKTILTGIREHPFGPFELAFEEIDLQA